MTAPLSLGPENCGDGRNITTRIGKEDVTVAHTSAVRSGGEDVVSKAEAEALAARIVTAVNAHDALVAAAKRSLEWGCGCDGGKLECGPCRGLRAALAKAGAK